MPKCVALNLFAIFVLTGCGGGGGGGGAGESNTAPTTPPVQTPPDPPPLVWDQADWDEVRWQ